MPFQRWQATTLSEHKPRPRAELRTFIRVGLLRPLHLLSTEPILSLVSIMAATAFGLIYFFTEVLAVVYGSYSFTVEQTSLAFLPIGIGFLCCAFTRSYDRRHDAKREKLGKVLSPEEQLVGFAIAAPALEIALWWFAWTVPPAVPHVPWVVSMLGLIPIGFAINDFDCVHRANSYTNFSSSA